MLRQVTPSNCSSSLPVLPHQQDGDSQMSMRKKGIKIDKMIGVRTLY